MFSKLLLTLSILISVSAFPQFEKNQRQNSNVTRTHYYLDFLNFKSDQNGMTRVDVFVQVPYTEVQFVKSANGFSASYSITISVFDENKEKLISEKSWTEKLEVKDFEQTQTTLNFNISLRSFNLQPGNYLIRSALEDKDSKQEFTVENKFVVNELSKPLSMSDLMIISRRDSTTGLTKILPNVTKNVLAQRDGLPLYFEIYSTRNQKIGLEYNILDPDNKVLYSFKDEKNIDTGKTQITYTFNDVKLNLGSYSVNVNLKNAGGETVSNIYKPFMSRWIGVPENISDMDKAVAQLIYIATPSELSEIEDANDQEEKIKRYLSFWKTKDPSPNTENNEIFNEYYRRISYANEKFSHYSEGWKTDRGMVFIILGPPSNVDRHPFDYDSKPYEVWEYYDLNKSFVFVDETGFGDYRLITPLHGDLYRYR